MSHIKITKGLDIPIKGKPSGSIKPLNATGETFFTPPSQIALDLTSFNDIKFRVLAKVGDHVKIGQPLVEDKDVLGRMFVAPAAGMVKEIRRGLKRRLLDIVIDVDKQEEYVQHPITDLSQISREELIERLKLSGIFSGIRQRPFNFLANPTKIPRNIFVKGLESAPFAPPAELQVFEHEKEFQVGLDALAKMTTGAVHLVYRRETTSRAFLDAKNVQKHTAEGPHPISNYSVHIQALDPIQSPEDIIWTLNAHQVVKIGHFLLTGRYLINRIIAIGGPGIVEDRIGYFKTREGSPIAPLVAGRIHKGDLRLISGDVLTGNAVEAEGFLGFNDYSFCVVPENHMRKLLHFFRLGTDSYTATGTYISGHLDNSHRVYNFTTNQHGESRPFIDGHVYDAVMPLNVSTIHLVKAVLAEDYDLAATLGLLDVDSEDFALPTFICPSKIEMMEIIKKGLHYYAADILR